MGDFGEFELSDAKPSRRMRSTAVVRDLLARSRLRLERSGVLPKQDIGPLALRYVRPSIRAAVAGSRWLAHEFVRRVQTVRRTLVSAWNVRPGWRRRAPRALRAGAGRMWLLVALLLLTGTTGPSRGWTRGSPLSFGNHSPQSGTAISLDFRVAAEK